MMASSPVGSSALTVPGVSAAPSQTPHAENTRPMLAHNVFFALNDNSDAARNKLIEACRRHLTGHPGTLFFAVGTIAGELTRSVNDRQFDVALHVVFDGKATHDAYQEHPRHLRFIEESKANWKQVRVFDSYVEGAG